MPHERKASVERVVALRVLVHLAGHGPNNSQFIDRLRDVRKHAAHRGAALSVSLELERRGHHVAVVVELGAQDFHRHRLAVQITQFRLRIKRVHLRNPT